MNAGAQAVQGEAGPGATPAHLSRQTMCRHWAKPKSLEGSELACSTSRQYPLHTPAQWRRNGVPCTSFAALGSMPIPWAHDNLEKGLGKYKLLYPSSSKLV